MSFSDGASEDISDDPNSNTIFTSSVARLHPPLVLDQTILDSVPIPLPSKQHADPFPQAPFDHLPHNSPFDGDDDFDHEGPLLPEEGALVGDDDDGGEGSFDLGDMTLIYTTRQQNRQPPPGTQRVQKHVRVRKNLSSSKRRTKKQALRAHLKESARIEEEMAELRGGKKKARPVPERRYQPVDLGPGSRGPSSLRFSENCYSDPEDPEKNTGLDKSPKGSDVSMEGQTPPKHDQLGSSKSMEWKIQTPPDIT